MKNPKQKLHMHYILYCFPDSSGKSLWGALSERGPVSPVISLLPILGELISEKCVKSMFPLNSIVPRSVFVKLNNLKTNKRKRCARVFAHVRVCVCVCVHVHKSQSLPW